MLPRNVDVYCQDRAAYAFTRRRMEKSVLGPARELLALCAAVIDRACADDEVMASLGVPRAMWDVAAASWRNEEPGLCLRLDLALDHDGTAKLIECNADNPGDLFLSGPFQRHWLDIRSRECALPGDAEQFNALEQELIAAFRTQWSPQTLHRFVASEHDPEEQDELRYLCRCARKAGVETCFEVADPVAYAQAVGGLQAAQVLHKKRPWSDPRLAPLAGAKIAVVEPLWRVILDSKGVLAWLWRMFPGHPNLLAAHLERAVHRGRPPRGWVAKPLYSCRGDNIEVESAAVPGGRLMTDGNWRGDRVVQSFQPLPTFPDGLGGTVRTLVGVWMVGRTPAAIRMAETYDHVLTAENYWFVPNVMLD